MSTPRVVNFITAKYIAVIFVCFCELRLLNFELSGCFKSEMENQISFD